MVSSSPRRPNRIKQTMVAAGLVGALYIGVTDIMALSLPGAQAIVVAPWSGAAIGKAAVSSAASIDLAGVAGQRVAREAVQALRREPLNFEAARVVALVDYRQDRVGQARTLFNLIGRQDLRELVSHIWLLTDAYSAGRPADVIREAVIIMRQEPQMVDQIYTLLTVLVDNNQAVGDLVLRLNDMPDWRAGFFDAFGERSTNSAAAFHFLSAVARSPHPPLPSELRVWLLHEAARTDGDELVRRWEALQRRPLPPAEALLRNPGFEGSAAPQPFDWTFYAPDGSFAEIGPSPNGNGKALYVEMTGSADVSVASQMLDLQPGSYVLETSVYPISETGRRDLKIRLECAQGRTRPQLAELPIVADQDRWSRIRWSFTVPATCHTQSLSIGMTPGSLTSDLRVYFDDMTIKRSGDDRPR